MCVCVCVCVLRARIISDMIVVGPLFVDCPICAKVRSLIIFYFCNIFGPEYDKI